MLSASAKNALVVIVRQALKAAVSGVDYMPAQPSEQELLACCGIFVTYKTAGELRGCIGCFTSEDPLYLCAAAYARASATEDPRFFGNPLREDDLTHVHLDISVLSPLTPCTDPEGIELGRHGIYLRRGGRSGCFLPQVADETGWSVEEFWSYCCSHKAGLPPDAWKQPATNLFTFTAEVIEAAWAD